MSDHIQVATEVKGSAVKSYGYGAYGERLTITDGANRYSYLYNQHGDVSLLIDQANTVKQAYGYTAYGGVDTTITKNASGFTDPNPYRYSAKRWDAATGTYDMGARRYNPATTRWMQQDMYYGSVDDLGLSRDPLTANRYLFTGANPVNFVEIDGHKPEPMGEPRQGVDSGFVTDWQAAHWKDLAYCTGASAVAAREAACKRAGADFGVTGTLTQTDVIIMVGIVGVIGAIAAPEFVGSVIAVQVADAAIMASIRATVLILGISEKYVGRIFLCVIKQIYGSDAKEWIPSPEKVVKAVLQCSQQFRRGGAKK